MGKVSQLERSIAKIENEIALLQEVRDRLCRERIQPAQPGPANTVKSQRRRGAGETARPRRSAPAVAQGGPVEA